MRQLVMKTRLHLLPSDHQQKGLSPERIHQFHQFLADESLAGDRCGVCLEDLVVGRRMVRFNCNV